MSGDKASDESKAKKKASIHSRKLQVSRQRKNSNEKSVGELRRTQRFRGPTDCLYRNIADLEKTNLLSNEPKSESQVSFVETITAGSDKIVKLVGLKKTVTLVLKSPPLSESAPKLNDKIGKTTSVLRQITMRKQTVTAESSQTMRKTISDVKKGHKSDSDIIEEAKIQGQPQGKPRRPNSTEGSIQETIDSVVRKYSSMPDKFEVAQVALIDLAHTVLSPGQTSICLTDIPPSILEPRSRSGSTNPSPTHSRSSRSLSNDVQLKDKDSPQLLAPKPKVGQSKDQKSRSTSRSANTSPITSQPHGSTPTRNGRSEIKVCKVALNRDILNIQHPKQQMDENQSCSKVPIGKQKVDGPRISKERTGKDDKTSKKKKQDSKVQSNIGKQKHEKNEKVKFKTPRICLSNAFHTEMIRMSTEPAIDKPKKSRKRGDKGANRQSLSETASKTPLTNKSGKACHSQRQQPLLKIKKLSRNATEISKSDQSTATSSELHRKNDKDAVVDTERLLEWNTTVECSSSGVKEDLRPEDNFVAVQTDDCIIDVGIQEDLSFPTIPGDITMADFEVDSDPLATSESYSQEEFDVDIGCVANNSDILNLFADELGLSSEENPSRLLNMTDVQPNELIIDSNSLALESELETFLNFQSSRLVTKCDKHLDPTKKEADDKLKAKQLGDKGPGRVFSSTPRFKKVQNVGNSLSGTSLPCRITERLDEFSDETIGPKASGSKTNVPKSSEPPKKPVACKKFKKPLAKTRLFSEDVHSSSTGASSASKTKEIAALKIRSVKLLPKNTITFQSLRNDSLGTARSGYKDKDQRDTGNGSCLVKQKLDSPASKRMRVEYKPLSKDMPIIGCDTDGNKAISETATNDEASKPGGHKHEFLDPLQTMKTTSCSGEDGTQNDKFDFSDIFLVDTQEPDPSPKEIAALDPLEIKSFEGFDSLLKPASSDNNTNDAKKIYSEPSCSKPCVGKMGSGTKLLAAEGYSNSGKMSRVHNLTVRNVACFNKLSMNSKTASEKNPECNDGTIVLSSKSEGSEHGSHHKTKLLKKEPCRKRKWLEDKENIGDKPMVEKKKKLDRQHWCKRINVSDNSSYTRSTSSERSADNSSVFTTIQRVAGTMDNTTTGVEETINPTNCEQQLDVQKNVRNVSSQDDTVQDLDFNVLHPSLESCVADSFPTGPTDPVDNSLTKCTNSSQNTMTQNQTSWQIPLGPASPDEPVYDSLNDIPCINSVASAPEATSASYRFKNEKDNNGNWSSSSSSSSSSTSSSDSLSTDVGKPVDDCTEMKPEEKELVSRKTDPEESATDKKNPEEHKKNSPVEAETNSLNVSQKDSHGIEIDAEELDYEPDDAISLFAESVGTSQYLGAEHYNSPSALAEHSYEPSSALDIDYDIYFDKNHEECERDFESCLEKENDARFVSPTTGRNDCWLRRKQSTDNNALDMETTNTKQNVESSTAGASREYSAPIGGPVSFMLPPSGQKSSTSNVKDRIGVIVTQDRPTINLAYIFKGHCYQKLTSGICKYLHCRFHHELCWDLQYLHSQSQEVINAVVDYSILKGYEYFVQNKYQSLLQGLDSASIMEMYHKLYNAGFINSGLVKVTVGALLHSGLTLAKIVRNLATLLNENDNVTPNLILEAVGPKAEAGYYWETLRDLFLRVEPPIVCIEIVLDECVRINNDRDHLEDVCVNFIRRLTNEQMSKINMNLRQDFNNLLEMKSLSSKSSTWKDDQLTIARLDPNPLLDHNSNVSLATGLDSLDDRSIISEIVSPDTTQSWDHTLHCFYDISQMHHRTNVQEPIVTQSSIRSQIIGSTSSMNVDQCSNVEINVEIKSTENGNNQQDFEGPFILHPIDDLPAPHSVYKIYPKSIYDEHVWKFNVDMYALHEGLKHEDYQYVLNILDKYQDTDHNILLIHCYNELRKEVLSSEQHVSKLIDLSVQTGMIEQLGALLCDIGMQVLIELADTGAWVIAYRLLKSMRTLGPQKGAAFALLSAEICLANRHPLKALAILKQTKMLHTSRQIWQVASNPKDEFVRTGILQLLLEVLSREYEVHAFGVFEFLAKDQPKVYHPIDLSSVAGKIADKLLTERQDHLLAKMGRLIIEKRLTLQSTVHRAIVASLLHIDINLARQLYRFGTWIGVYPMFQFNAPMHLMMYTRWTEEEIYLVIAEFLDKLSMNIGHAIDHLKPTQFCIHLVFEVVPTRQQLRHEDPAKARYQAELRERKTLVKKILKEKFDPPIKTIVKEQGRFVKLQSASLVAYLKATYMTG